MNKHNDIYSRDYISYYIDSEKYTKSVTVYCISASATGTSAIPHNDERYFSVARVLLK